MAFLTRGRYRKAAVVGPLSGGRFWRVEWERWIVRGYRSLWNFLLPLGRMLAYWARCQCPWELGLMMQCDTAEAGSEEMFAVAVVGVEVSSLEKEGPTLVAWRRRQVTRVRM